MFRRINFCNFRLSSSFSSRKQLPLSHLSSKPITSLCCGPRLTTSPINYKIANNRSFSEPPLGVESLDVRRSAEELFNNLWSDLQKSIMPNARFPREIIWLGGAPGSGKSTHTATIMERRGITGGPIIISDLFTSPEAQKFKEKGLLLDDSLVIRLLLEKLLDPKLKDGVVIDGFPRTPIQVECVKILYSMLQDLQKNSEPPYFRVVVLYIDKDDSVDRQLQRGREVIEHNRIVRETGKGKLKEERPTDVDTEAARSRYQLFYDQTYSSLMALRSQFPFHVINSQGPTSQTRQNILNEIQSI